MGNTSYSKFMAIYFLISYNFLTAYEAYLPVDFLSLSKFWPTEETLFLRFQSECPGPIKESFKTLGRRQGWK
jgi:hypothetical protein